MKRITLLLIVILSCVSVYAQNDTVKSKMPKLKYGVNVGYYGTRNINNALSPGFDMRLGNQNFMIGPMVFFGNNSVDEKYTQWGINYTYKIFPNPTSHVFNFYFLYHFQFGMDKKERDVDYYNNSDIHLVGSVTLTKYSITNCIGYGYKIKIVKGLYFNNSIGVGIGLYRMDSKAEYPEVPEASYFVKGNMFSEGKLTVFANFGFGYDF